MFIISKDVHVAHYRSEKSVCSRVCMSDCEIASELFVFTTCTHMYYLDVYIGLYISVLPYVFAHSFWNMHNLCCEVIVIYQGQGSTRSRSKGSRSINSNLKVMVNI